MSLLGALPPSSRTSLAIDVLCGTTLEDHRDHLIVRTPANPSYHWGNFVQVTTGDVNDVDTWLGVFAAEHPNAPHRAIGLPSRPDAGIWERAGLRVEVDEALTLAGIPAATPAPAGYTVRRLLDDADWNARLDAELAENRATGEYPDTEHRVFLTKQVRLRRQLVHRGLSAWFGAFAPCGDLAGSLGIVILDDVARYQSVLTDTAHRRRGIARHLLAVAGRWAQSRGSARLVIVAEADSDAERLYARAGFVPGEPGFGAYSATWPAR